VHGLRQKYHRLENHFECTRWNSSVTWVLWNLILVHLETVFVSVQDRCTVCAKHTIGLEIVLDAPEELVGDVGHLESRFCPFGDGVRVGAQFVPNIP
jgi:hypothetical protein